MATLDTAAQSVWATKPLPRGWEAKLDPLSNRYFFVNHEIRSTQWEDPRIALYGQQQQQQHQQEAARILNGMANAAAAGSSPGSSPIEFRNLGQTKCSTCHTNNVMFAGGNCAKCAKTKMTKKNSPVSSSAETTLTQVSPVLVAKLLVAFPEAGKDLVTAIFKQFNNNYADAETHLELMGFKNMSKNKKKRKPKQQQQQQQEEVVENEDDDFPPIDGDDLHLPGWVTQQMRSSSEIRTEVFESLQKDFKQLPEAELKRILKECGYSEARARSTAAMWQPAVSGSTNPVSPITSPQVSNSHPSSLVDINISFVDEDPPPPTPSTSDPSARRSSVKISAQPQKVPRERVAPTPRPPVLTNSQYRTTPVGANPNLAKGPDRGLLRSTRTLSVGSDSSLACGPDERYAKGRQTTAAKGPQRNLCVGPDRSILVGSMYHR